MKAHEILENTAKIVKGSRNDTHGDKRISFEAIASFWTLYIQNKYGLNIQLDSVDVAQMMVLLKVVRSTCGKSIEDHFMDAAGYSAIAGELASLDKLDDDPFIPQLQETPDEAY